MRELGGLHPSTGVGIEHPLRNLQSWEPLERIAHALQNKRVASACLATNQHSLPMPRVPAILHLSKASFMGVPYLGCTTRSDRTRRWATKPPAPQALVEATGAWGYGLPEGDVTALDTERSTVILSQLTMDCSQKLPGAWLRPVKVNKKA